MNKEILEAARRCLKADQIGCKGCPLDDSLNITVNCVNYIIKNFLDNHNKYRWHDLRKDPTDLPTEDKVYYIVEEDQEDGELLYDTANVNYIRHYAKEKNYWFKVIAWREIDLVEPFERKEMYE